MSNWSGVSQAYWDSFASLCAGTEARILDDLPIGPLLDVGSGTGSLARAALERGFTVTAVDADPDMVAMTNELAPDACTQQALPALAFASGSFPAVSANFVVNHLSDPRAGVRELARVTGPGGRVAMTVWPAGGTGWAPFVAEVFAAAQAAEIPSTRLPAELDFPRTEAGLSDLGAAAGLRVITSTTLHWQWHVSPSKLWAGVSGGVATPGARYLAQSVEVRDLVAKTFLKLARQRMDQGELCFDCHAVYVLAEH